MSVEDCSWIVRRRVGWGRRLVEVAGLLVYIDCTLVWQIGKNDLVEMAGDRPEGIKTARAWVRWSREVSC